MSIRYSCFGIPKTFEEFVDRAVSSGIPKVEVMPVAYSKSSFAGIFGGFCGLPDEANLFLNYHRAVYLRAGKTTLRIYKGSGPLMAVGNGIDKHMAKVREDVLTEAERIASRLKEQGLEVEVLSDRKSNPTI